VGTTTTTSYAYDPEGDLVGAGGDTYVYDADGDRVSETENGVTTTQVFDGDTDDIIQQVDGADGTNSSPITTNYVYGANGLASADPASDSDDAGVVYYGEDALGSVVDLTDAAGNATDEYAYDAFGQNLAHSGSSVQPFTFMGNEVDTTTGDDDFNAREYNPALGTFLSQDPVAGNSEAPVTEDAYIYGDDNPYADSDPTGMATNMQDEVGSPPSSVPNGYSYYLESGDSEDGLDFWGLVEDGVEIVHQASGVVAGLAAICAIATSETIIGGATCGSIAIVAEGVHATTGVALYATGHENATQLAVDGAALTLAGVGGLVEGAAKTYEAASGIAAAHGAISWAEGLAESASGWADISGELAQSASNLVRGVQLLHGLSALGDLYGVAH
jgi:RHS repeat-associated protein